MNILLYLYALANSKNFSTGLWLRLIKDKNVGYGYG